MTPDTPNFDRDVSRAESNQVNAGGVSRAKSEHLPFRAFLEDKDYSGSGPMWSTTRGGLTCGVDRPKFEKSNQVGTKYNPIHRVRKPIYHISEQILGESSK